MSAAGNYIFIYVWFSFVRARLLAISWLVVNVWKVLSCRVVEYIRFLALPSAAAGILDGCHIVQFGSLRLKFIQFQSD